MFMIFLSLGLISVPSPHSPWALLSTFSLTWLLGFLAPPLIPPPSSPLHLQLGSLAPLWVSIWFLCRGRALAHFGLALCLLVHGASSLLLESANHSFHCQLANWFILPPTRLSLPCRNEAISPRWRLPVPAAAGIINEDKVPAA